MPKRVCLVCPRPAMAGTSRCYLHQRGSRKARNPEYDARHQALAKRCLAQRPLVCRICGLGEEAIATKGPFQADHILPLSLGGKVEPGNYAPAHRKCNIAKGGRNRKVRSHE